MADLEIDRASMANLKAQFKRLKIEGGKSVFDGLVKFGNKIATTAQLRLTGRGHIVTSRLKNSISIQTQTKQHGAYTDNEGHVFNGNLSEPIGKDELLVGTNVEYAPKIEKMDSYLYWAVKNVDVRASLAKEMKNFIKFGSRLT